MDQTNEFAAAILRKTTGALAACAADDLLKAQPEAGKHFGTDPFEAWKNCLARRLEELSAAVAVSRPEIFVEQYQWSVTAGCARGARASDFRAAMESLRTVLERELPDRARAHVLAVVDKVLEAPDCDTAVQPSGFSVDSDEQRLSASYTLAVLEGNRRRAIQMLLDAAESGMRVEDIYVRVLIPAQREIGRMWQAAEINIAEEHFATETTRTAISRLYAHAHIRPPNGKTVISAAITDNDHCVALDVISNLFEFDGWRVITLGKSMPLTDLVQAVAFFEADLLALSVALRIQLPQVQACVEAVRRGQRPVKILVGGTAFDGQGDLALELGADRYGATAEEAIAAGRELVGLPIQP